MQNQRKANGIELVKDVEMRTLATSQYLSVSTAGFGMEQKNNNLGGLKMNRADDEAQIEYIRKWCEMKEKDKEEKMHRKRMRKFHLLRAKWYLEKAFKDLMHGLFV